MRQYGTTTEVLTIPVKKKIKKAGKKENKITSTIIMVVI